MPPSSRGSQYIGNAHAFLNCRVDHDKIANDLFSKISSNGETYTTEDCSECGAYIVVSKRESEWETKVFSRGPSKER
jgi:hypothetical protein